MTISILQTYFGIDDNFGFKFTERRALKHLVQKKNMFYIKYYITIVYIL